MKGVWDSGDGVRNIGTTHVAYDASPAQRRRARPDLELARYTVFIQITEGHARLNYSVRELFRYLEDLVHSVQVKDNTSRNLWRGPSIPNIRGYH